MTDTQFPLKAAGVRWDISDLYAGAEDSRLAFDLERALQQAEAFHQRYYGKIAGGELEADRKSVV